MIISHKYKFIFLKTNKTAGTSTEIALSKFCNKGDIITPTLKVDEKIRNNLGYQKPQNYLESFSKYNALDFARLIIDGEKKKRFYNHIPAKKVKEKVNNHVWKNYYKFCFERNPWDRVISLFYHLKNISKLDLSISEFINSDYPLVLKKGGLNVYTIDGEIVVDKIAKFENIESEIESIRKKIGLPEKVKLPRAKSNYRKDRRSYREILNTKDKNKIAEIFAEEIELMNYEF